MRPYEKTATRRHICQHAIWEETTCRNPGGLAIREKFAAGVGMGELVREYGVSDASISNVVNGKTWKHVGGPTGTHGRPGRRPNRKEAA